MNETLKGLYNYLLAHKNESLTEVGCVGTVEGVTTDNVMQLLNVLQNEGKIALEHDYLHYEITGL